MVDAFYLFFVFFFFGSKPNLKKFEIASIVALKGVHVAVCG